MEEIVTGDETLIYYFEPESVPKDKGCITSDGERPFIARLNETSNLMLSAIFCHSKGFVFFKHQFLKVVLLPGSFVEKCSHTSR